MSGRGGGDAKTRGYNGIKQYSGTEEDNGKYDFWQKFSVEE